MSGDPTKTAYPRDAAMLKFEAEVLSKKIKGDCITAREFLECTGMQIDSFRGRLRTWAKHRNFTLRAVPNDGYRILVDSELSTAGLSRQRSAHKQLGEEVRTLHSADTTKLDDEQVRRLGFQKVRAERRFETSRRDLKDTRREFKMTERVPLRLASQDEDEEQSAVQHVTTE